MNTYKRLVPGYEAPVYLSWARRNRSDLIRVPVYKPGKEKATRIEYRAPDPACNPYLAFAAMLTAGLEGIEKGYECPPPVEENVYEMSEEERAPTRHQTRSPATCGRRSSMAEQSDLLRRALGDHVFEKLIENKKIEWAELPLAGDGVRAGAATCRSCKCGDRGGSRGRGHRPRPRGLGAARSVGPETRRPPPPSAWRAGRRA